MKRSWKSKRISAVQVRQALKGARDNVAAAARALGLSRETLSRWLNNPSFATEVLEPPTPRKRRVKVAPIPIDVILDGPRPGPDEAAADARWLELRREIFAQLTCTEFDPRVPFELDLTCGRLERWKANRRRHIAKMEILGPTNRIEDICWE